MSEPEKEYLWILARAPVIAADDYLNLLTRLSHQGFDIRRLEVTRQD